MCDIVIKSNSCKSKISGGIEMTNKKEWRDYVIKTAKEYADYEWIPTEKNMFHGNDKDGVLVNTPDISYFSEIYKCGWWRIGRKNIGVAYNWGGDSTIKDFEEGVAKGKYAGNVPDRRSNPRSYECVGVDCSGLLSICWQLPKKLATKALPNVADKLDDISSLQKGDILLWPGIHVMIFLEFVNKEMIRIIDCTRTTGKVMEREVNIEALVNMGYWAYTINFDKVKAMRDEMQK